VVEKGAPLVGHSRVGVRGQIKALEERVVGNGFVIAGLVVEQASIIVVTLLVLVRVVPVLARNDSGGGRVV
jgi:hypothetical protein